MRALVIFFLLITLFTANSQNIDWVQPTWGGQSTRQSSMATDSAGNQFNDTITVNYSPLDTTAPVVTIKSPTTRSKYRTKNSHINLSGSASDNVSVSQVNWINSQGGNGTASGTSSWSISGIPLEGGENILTITAKDATGNQSTDKLTVVRRSGGKPRRK